MVSFIELKNEFQAFSTSSYVVHGLTLLMFILSFSPLGVTSSVLSLSILSTL